MYQVIARKYRPQNFDEVVDQEHVKQTLRNALLQDRVGHGYIFSGPRGTGKTTMARIVAKTLNCEQGPTPNPCLKCPSCKEISAGNSIDVIEIDAASNRRIDDIRELRENVRYRPVRDHRKVFIIDEAHQITSDAFNALLKTLEEPPEWVVFILCTTEPHEFPSTIVSRCQTFPFRTVDYDLIVEHLNWICKKEEVEADQDTLISIALAGDGSIRDSLSTLDQAIACFGKRLEATPVRDLLGSIPVEITQSIVASLRESKSSTILEIVDQLYREGRNLQHFCGELTRYFRNLLVMKIAGSNTRLVTIEDKEREALSTYTTWFSEEDLTRYMKLLLDLYRDLQHATEPRLRLEVGLLKLVYARQIQSIEKVLSNLQESQPSPSEEPDIVGSPESFRSTSISSKKAPKPDAQRLSSSVSETSKVRDKLGGRSKQNKKKSQLESSLEQGGDSLALAHNRTSQKETKNSSTDSKSNAETRAMEDPQVKKFQEMFDGQIREIRNLKEYLE